MKFYQENKINPLASCLPLVMQLPVFVSLFYMLRTDLKKHICGPQLVSAYHSLHPGGAIAKVSGLPSKFIEDTSCEQVAHHSAKFLFLPDITSKATGVALVVLIVLYVGSQLGSTLIATASADPNQRRLMLLLPVVFVVILYRYPAGLLVYWITTNLWTVGQQYLIRRHMGPAPPKPEPAPGAATNGKPSGSLRSALAGAVGMPSQAQPDPKPVVSGPPPSSRKKKKRSGRRR